jgi:hypothetical protein
MSCVKNGTSKVTPLNEVTTKSVTIISPTYAQLFLYCIHLAYMFRPIRSSSGHLRYTKRSKMCLKYLEYIKLLKHLSYCMYM